MKVSKETSAKHREELLNAASRLFRERGFDKVGIAEIAAAAGLTHGAFYTHFDSKEALCAEVIGPRAARLLRWEARIPVGTPASHELRCALPHLLLGMAHATTSNNRERLLPARALPSPAPGLCRSGISR